MARIGTWRILQEWKIQGNWAIRYYHHGGKTIQISRYREADDFDKHMGNRYKWHGKWYVDFMDGRERLFKTKQAAMDYAIKYMKLHP
jgi:hypothetical protein